MKLGIIPCSNGMGHIARSAKLANILIKNYRIVFFLSKKKIKLILNKKIIVKKVSENFRLVNNHKYNVNWYKNFNNKNYDNIDLFISDNLPEIVLNKKIVLIYANFFWHEIFNIQNTFFKNLKKEFRKKKVKIIFNYLFGNTKISKKKIYSVGFVGKYKKNVITKKKGILISLGTSTIGYTDISKNILKIISEKEFLSYEFYLDKKLLNNKTILTKNIKKADFSENMFKNIRVAFIKPGFGTIHDCLERGIPINSYLSSKNKEFIYNAKILKKIKVGNYFLDFKKGLKNTIDIFNNIKKIKEINKTCKSLRWNGERDIKNIIQKYKKNINDVNLNLN